MLKHVETRNCLKPPGLRVQVPEILLDLLGPWLGQRRLKHLLLSLINWPEIEKKRVTVENPWGKPPGGRWIQVATNRRYLSRNIMELWHIIMTSTETKHEPRLRWHCVWFLWSWALEPWEGRAGIAYGQWLRDSVRGSHLNKDLWIITICNNNSTITSMNKYKLYTW